MKIFVGWPYEATWIETYAVPLIKSYGVEVLIGKELQGQIITAGVKAIIEEADAVVCFTTRREQGDGAVWKTSDWVIDEIKHANSINKDKVLEIREEGVQWPNMIHVPRQHILLNPVDRVPGLVALGQTIGRWQGITVKLKLLPEEFIREIRARLNPKRYKCMYSIRRAGRSIYGPKEAEIHREGAGLFVYVDNLPDHPDAFIEVDVDIGNQWSSPGIPLNSVDIVLEKYAG